MSIFDELLDIKAFRERKAETAVVRARGEVTLRHRQMEAAEQALVAWRDEAVARELALYGDLCARLVRVRDIENVQQEVAGFRHVEFEREQDVERAQNTLDEARQVMSRASEALVQANRAKEKFIELAADYADEVRREAERREDLEMEEAASMAQEREALEEWEARQDG